MKKKISVSGMHCANCALNIEKTLKRDKRIKDATVNFSTNTASVDYDEKSVGIEEIIRKIADIGYSAAEVTKGDDVEKREREKELNHAKKMTLISFVFAVPVFVFTVGYLSYSDRLMDIVGDRVVSDQVRYENRFDFHSDQVPHWRRNRL